MKVSKHFDIKEIVHNKFIEDHGEAKMCKVFQRYAPDTLNGLERIREWLDEPIFVNDWSMGGNRINSGLRHPQFPFGSPLSAHMFFLAMDIHVKGVAIKDLQEDILMNQNSHPLISRMEDHRDTPTWLHIQCSMRTKNQQIKIFRP